MLKRCKLSIRCKRNTPLGEEETEATIIRLTSQLFRETFTSSKITFDDEKNNTSSKIHTYGVLEFQLTHYLITYEPKGLWEEVVGDERMDHRLVKAKLFKF
jgi:hypothetical protein